MNAMIDLHKIATLADNIGTRKITHELILEVIHQHCNEAEARLEDYYGEYKVHLATADCRDTKYLALEGIL